jgi:hypothetical protein
MNIFPSSHDTNELAVAFAIKSCTDAPTVPILIGRKDSSTA